MRSSRAVQEGGGALCEVCYRASVEASAGPLAGYPNHPDRSLEAACSTATQPASSASSTTAPIQPATHPPLPRHHYSPPPNPTHQPETAA